MTRMDKSEKILEIKGIDIEYGRRARRFKAVNNVSFDIFKGEIFALVGESGSGKTSIGRAIIRLNEISKGQIFFQGRLISGKIDKDLNRQVNKNIQMIFQDPISSLNERAKISYIVSEGLHNFNRELKKNEINYRIDQALLDVGLLPEHASRFPHEFSGGQRQRIGIARALIMEPKLIIADEPISALDATMRMKVINLLIDLQRTKNLTYLFISHDLSMVKNLSSRMAVLYQGHIVEMGDTKKIFNNPLHPYTQILISSILIPDPLRKRKKDLLKINPPKDFPVASKNQILTEVETNHYVLIDRSMPYK